MKLRLICRIGDVRIGEIVAEYVPHKGDLLMFVPPKTSPFANQSIWRVDEVVWNVAQVGSYYHMERIRDHLPTGQDGHVQDADVLVWPEPGPYWHDTPDWASTLEPEDEAEHE